jgi:hypothetical protein
MVAGPIWHKFLEAALADSPPEGFTPPAQEMPEKPVFRGVYRAGPVLKIDKISKKLATPSTPPELIEEISFGEVVSILALVTKDDPLGPPPADPDLDPQYHLWQAAIEKWIRENPLPAVEPPKESDDLHAVEKHPRLGIVIPDEGSGITQKLEIVEVLVNAAFPLREISFFLDEILVASRTAPIASERVRFDAPAGIAPGRHIIKITAYDAVGNKTSVEREIVIEE